MRVEGEGEERPKWKRQGSDVAQWQVGTKDQGTGRGERRFRDKELLSSHGREKGRQVWRWVEGRRNRERDTGLRRSRRDDNDEEKQMLPCGHLAASFKARLDTGMERNGQCRRIVMQVGFWRIWGIVGGWQKREKAEKVALTLNLKGSDLTLLAQRERQPVDLRLQVCLRDGCDFGSAHTCRPCAGPWASGRILWRGTRGRGVILEGLEEVCSLQAT